MIKLNLKNALLILIFSFSSVAFSAEEIHCTAQYLEFSNNGTTISEQVPLDIIESTEHYIQLSTDLRLKNFSFSGDLKQNIFYVSITDLPNHAAGSLTTASFSNDDRLQLSIVNENIVYKLECFKTN
jgi:hypothetical protein